MSISILVALTFFGDIYRRKEKIVYNKEQNFSSTYKVGILSGGILSIVFINPYDGRILVSEAILQLSGSSGAFPPPAFKDLISFTIRMIPDYMFELYIGIELYRHFVQQSVYVFSRTPNRSRWYIREVIGSSSSSFGYQIIKMFAAMRCDLFYTIR